MSQFSSLLRKCCSAASRHADLNRELHDAFVERYGADYSDLDADEIIDSTDYGAGGIGVRRCDEIMRDLGYPRIKK